MSKILFAAKHSWTTLRMSRPLFAGSYRSRGGLSANEKEKNLHRMIIRFTFYLLPLLGSPASSSPRDINTDTDYLKTARKGGGHKGKYLQCCYRGSHAREARVGQSPILMVYG